MLCGAWDKPCIPDKTEGEMMVKRLSEPLNKHQLNLPIYFHGLGIKQTVLKTFPDFHVFLAATLFQHQNLSNAGPHSDGLKTRIKKYLVKPHQHT